jgi:hypothetical protein
MPCQIGIYESPNDSLDNWNALIYLREAQTPRDLLREMAPFLRQFHALHDMHDAESLGAWLTWHLIDSSAVVGMDLPRIALSRQIQTDIEYFCRVTPGLVEVYRVDELLEWRIIAALEIPQDQVGVEAEAEAG